jgi:hypothetical protein
MWQFFWKRSNKNNHAKLKKGKGGKQVVKVTISLTSIEKTIWKELNEQQWVDFILI